MVVNGKESKKLWNQQNKSFQKKLFKKFSNPLQPKSKYLPHCFYFQLVSLLCSIQLIFSNVIITLNPLYLTQKKHFTLFLTCECEIFYLSRSCPSSLHFFSLPKLLQLL